MKEVKNEVKQEDVKTQEGSYKSGSVQYIDSREVAEMVGKNHRDLLRDIRRYCKQMEEINQRNTAPDNFNQLKIEPSDFFTESTYVDGKGEKRPCYLITKKGCEFIAQKLTGEKGAKSAIAFINRFHEMGIKQHENRNKRGSVKYIDSREVATMVGKDHDKLCRDIRRYTSHLDDANFGEISIFWIESTYKDTYGRKQKSYLVTKKGCEFIANKLTGEKGSVFTATYINRFHEMEEELVVGPGQGLAEEMVDQILQFMEQQTELNKKMVDMIRTFSQVQEKPLAEERPLNPFDPGKGVLKERMETLNYLVDQVAELCGLERNRLLHYMYQALQENMKINLKSYRNVYQTELNDDSISNFHLICMIDRIYKKAVEMNRDVIERKKVFG